MAAVAQKGDALQFASEELKNDREIVMAAMVKLYHNLKLGRVNTLKEVVMAAVTQNGDALRYASNELENDKEIVMAAVAQKGRALEYASEELKNDKEIVMAAVTQDGLALEYASNELKKDKEIVMAAVAQDGGAIIYVSEWTELKNDPAFRDAIATAGVAKALSSELESAFPALSRAWNNVKKTNTMCVIVCFFFLFSLFVMLSLFFLFFPREFLRCSSSC